MPSTKLDQLELDRLVEEVKVAAMAEAKAQEARDAASAVSRQSESGRAAAPARERYKIKIHSSRNRSIRSSRRSSRDSSKNVPSSH